MHIISNNCLGSFIYRDILKQEYSVPFSWCRIKEDSFIPLLENLYKIDFNNYELKKNGNELKDGFHIVIENKIRLYYTHYHFDQNCAELKIDGINVFYNRIWEYIVEKYEKRLNRFNKINEICIAVEDFPQCPYNVSKILNICIKNNWKIILITKQKIKSNYEKLLLLNHYTNINEPHVYTEAYKNEILNFCNT